VRIGQRLFLAVVPAVLGVLTVAGLAYWGQYGHQAPDLVVAIAIVAAVASLVVAWLNTRYVARRVERLAGVGDQRPRSRLPQIRSVADAVSGRAIASSEADELDAIETAVDRLNSAVAVAEADRARGERAVEDRLRQHAELLAAATAAVARCLDEIRLPLHILLENRFGDLNENQEEMLESARTAAERAQGELRCVAEIADLDRGTTTLRRDRVHVAEVLRSLSPTLESEGAPRRVHIVLDVAPALPPILGDRARLQEALGLLLGDVVRGTPADGTVRIAADRDGDNLRMSISNTSVPLHGAGPTLARGLINAHGGTLESTDDHIVITLPAARLVIGR
jgi:signal transduction histidine kinase